MQNVVDVKSLLQSNPRRGGQLGVVAALESTLLNNLETDGFTLKLGTFGKFSVQHKAGILRKIPFTGETILTKDRRKVTFVSLGSLRQWERTD